MSRGRNPRRPCTKCGRNRAERFFSGPRGSVCSDCRKKRVSVANWAARIEKLYRLTRAMYEQLLSFQDGVCAICGGKRPYRLNVDHDHDPASPFVRGLLCRRCNTLLADAGDNAWLLRAAADYLDDPPAYRCLGQIEVGEAPVRRPK